MVVPKFQDAFWATIPFLFDSTQQLGENAPETADLYFSYGRALLENAIVQNSVLGKEQREDVAQEDSKGNVCGFFYYFETWANLRFFPP